ncbi:ATP synthase F1 subunit gamma [Marinitoga sp. 1135]|uniref:ATP synthase gamma chain n=1 Tax=Marinitoga piezophila (strain DSM 14283 / JCM 11233 / KA3) TaxID=443254 RepID=H2J4P2_MARPK|nr:MULTISPECIES: ATP synthase F1 subunit gamma [Marinitoga]AEX85984.1 ATP synthase, F1 gamma subunit [Marinitoga piezophila KA3]APT76407.1 ATP synthase F1 subunit gamma [Marinitoga sp. 1137]NUU96177.1 ATP synthase F1 subunit gamma [Marinitoga sp. 1135]NUU98085.1 ATP synthase F1 subunit gamma [Marinitoga sp. 1138]
MSRGKLRILKQRRASTQSTMKITKAMEMVAAAKANKIVKDIQALKDYAYYAEKVIKKLSPVEDSIYTSKKPGTLIVTVTPDMGLCGAFPMELAKEAMNLANKTEDFVGFVNIGTKGEIELKKTGKLILSRTKLYDVPTQENAEYVLDDIIDIIEEKGIGKVKVVYGAFKNALVQKPEIVDLLPVSFEGKNESRYEYEPDSKELFEEAAYLYLLSKMYMILYETKISELYARKNAMHNATDNAKNLIEKLTLAYNKARQASITQELIEIVNGAQALQEE